MSHILPTPRQEHVEKKKTSSISPYLINYNDEIGHRLKGVLEDNSQKKTKRAQILPFDPFEVETEMLTKSLWSIFTGLPYVPPKLSKERAARLQELLHFCTSAEITNAGMHIKSFFILKGCFFECKK